MLQDLTPEENHLLHQTMQTIKRVHRPPDQKLMALAQVLAEIPSTTSTVLYATDEHEGTFCCIVCRREMARIWFPLIRKYVMPGACGCDAQRMAQEALEKERKERKSNMERAYRHSIMSDSLKQATFQNFERRRGTESVLLEAKKFAQEFEHRKQGLFFYGKPGNGKSHLMAAIHHEIDRQGYVSLFLDCAQLFNLAKDTMNKNSKVSLTDIINAAIECDLLTLDELGSGFLTEYEMNDILFPIINGRQGKKTNFTTNLDLLRLKTWFAFDKYKNPLDVDGRLIDRVIGSCDIYENVASSKRQEDALKRMEGA